MTRARRSILTATALSVAGALGLWACSTFRGESPSRGTLLFSHANHVERAECAECHGEVAKSTGATRGEYIPKGHTACAKCHDDEVKNKCEYCHHGAKEGISLRRVDRGLRYSHAAHVGGGRVKDCASCHPKAGKPAATLVPGHGTCNTSACHRHTYKELSCDKCHADMHRFGTRPVLAGLNHGPDFRHRHGPLARTTIKACAQCHDQTHCAECHARTAPARASILFPEQVDRGFIHRGDYLTRHQIEARAEPASCMKCHGQRHCRSCHSLNGLAEKTESNAPGNGLTVRRYHPAGWATGHGRAARQDIRVCASCHDRGAQSNCVSCHRVGGVGGSPHPPGWSWRNKTAQCLNSNMCKTCHPAGQGCR